MKHHGNACLKLAVVQTYLLRMLMMSLLHPVSIPAHFDFLSLTWVDFIFSRIVIQDFSSDSIVMDEEELQFEF